MMLQVCFEPSQHFQSICNHICTSVTAVSCGRTHHFAYHKKWVPDRGGGKLRKQKNTLKCEKLIELIGCTGATNIGVM